MVQNVSMVKHWVRDMMNMITNVYAPMTTQEKIVKHVSNYCIKKYVTVFSSICYLVEHSYYNLKFKYSHLVILSSTIQFHVSNYCTSLLGCFCIFIIVFSEALRDNWDRCYRKMKIIIIIIILFNIQFQMFRLFVHMAGFITTTAAT